MRTAVRNSLNTTAVRLLEEIGVNASIQYLNKMGIPTEKSDRNLSLCARLNDLWRYAGGTCGGVCALRERRRLSPALLRSAGLNPQTEASFTNEKKAENR